MSGPGARGRRCAGRGGERPLRHGCPAETRERSPTSAGRRGVPHLCCPHLPSRQLHTAPQEPPSPRGARPGGLLLAAWPCPLGQEGAAGAGARPAVRRGRVTRSPAERLCARDGGHTPVRRSVTLAQTAPPAFRVPTNPSLGLPSTRSPSAGHGGTFLDRPDLLPRLAQTHWLPWGHTVNQGWKWAPGRDGSDCHPAAPEVSPAADQC